MGFDIMNKKIFTNQKGVKMEKLKRCTRCVMPETWEGITFDEEGVCSICREYEKKKYIDWKERQKNFKEILQEYKKYANKKSNKYNCIIGYSGGKDTAYTLWAMVKKYVMKPLVLTFDHGFPLSAGGKFNLQEIPKILDCDHLTFTLGNGLRNSLCKKGSEKNGDFCWHCHNGIRTLIARISKQWDIPLQIWGEPSAEYQTSGAYKLEDMEEQGKSHYYKMVPIALRPKNMIPSGYTISDLLPMSWPSGEFLLRGIYLGTYEWWDQRKHVDIITKELGWKHQKVEGTYVDWDKVDCPFEPVRDWQKFIKRGFGRTTFQASKDIREGLISREEGLRLVEKHDGKRPKALDLFLKEVGMTEDEFNEITKRHIVK